LGDVIARKQDALAAYQARLQLQFSGLDALLKQLQTQSDFLTRQLR